MSVNLYDPILKQLVPIAGLEKAQSIEDVDDIDIVSPADGQSLVYDSETGKWVNKTPESAWAEI